MPIPENIIEKIQNNVDIVEVISGYVSLKKIGRSYKANCPFHNEKTPSFIVSAEKQIYHCFGCGAGGNVFSFVMKYENIQFPEAVEILAKKAGVVLPRSSRQSDELGSLANHLYEINEMACQFFQLRLSANTAAKDYLATRGVAEDTIKKLKIGYAPLSWDGLINYFKTKNISAALLEKAGLIIPNDRGGHYDRFRNRITFPIIDLKDRVLGFGARVLDSSLPKYLNSPETIIYSKGKNLYGLNLSKEHIKKSGHALIVEGYLDFIVPYQAGVQNIIATLGTALTSEQIKLLKRFGKTVVMVYDPDEAGEAASLRGLDLFISEDVNVYIAELPAGLDPDSYIRKFGTEDFIKLMKSSKNVFEYKFDKLARRFNQNTMNGKANIVSEMLPTISRISNAVLKSGLIKKLAERLSVDEDAIKSELKKVRTEYIEKKYPVVPVEVKKDSTSAERVVLALLFEGASFIDRIESGISLDEVKSTSVRDVMAAAFALHKENKEITPSRLINYLNNSTEAAALISEGVSILETMDDKEKALAECVSRIKKDAVKDRLNRLQDEIKMAHKNKDEALENKLVEEFHNLVKIGKV